MTLPMRDFALEVHFSKWEFDARYNMTASDLESMRLSDLLALASDADREAFDAVHLGYTKTFGAPELLAEIAGTYDGVAPDDLLCFAGAEEGIYTAMRVILSPDDHAIVITPNYQAAETVPLAICAVTGVALDIDRGWDLDLDEVRSAIRPNTRLISINFPNNPTGRILPRQLFNALVELCRARGIWLF
ncbi:MAG TPA: aminotransferase class I/II-fold pyridoxal phosphate-dependent enzyme, partial [Methylomirabilota bacterium]|nr:aminotransferase class I/II-fold pyridoxal phosphate-dependent enzyme [Methylomirabilota bacterium]